MKREFTYGRGRIWVISQYQGKFRGAYTELGCGEVNVKTRPNYPAWRILAQFLCRCCPSRRSRHQQSFKPFSPTCASPFQPTKPTPAAVGLRLACVGGRSLLRGCAARARRGTARKLSSSSAMEASELLASAACRPRLAFASAPGGSPAWRGDKFAPDICDTDTAAPSAHQPLSPAHRAHLRLVSDCRGPRVLGRTCSRFSMKPLVLPGRTPHQGHHVPCGVQVNWVGDSGRAAWEEPREGVVCPGGGAGRSQTAGHRHLGFAWLQRRVWAHPCNSLLCHSGKVSFKSKGQSEREGPGSFLGGIGGQHCGFPTPQETRSQSSRLFYELSQHSW